MRINRAFAFVLSVVLACAAQAQNGATTAVLKTRDTRLEVSAGRQAPRLISLSGPSGNEWRNTSEEDLPVAVEVNGINTSITWQLMPQSGTVDAHHVVFIYECARPHMRVRWQWESRAGFGPIEHRITIENLGSEEIWLPLVDSLKLNWRVAPAAAFNNFYVEKGADTPSAQGTHLEPIDSAYRWIGRSSTYAHPQNGLPREIIPAEFIYSAAGTISGWYTGIEFSGRTRITLERAAESLKSTLGLDPEPGPFRTRLVPGGSFETPTVFLGAFTGGPDGAGNQLRPWVRAALGNPLTWKDPHYPLTVNNSWGSGMEVDEALALRMISASRELGLEMFHLDAGWFRGVGDWYPNPKKFPHGLEVIAGEAHRQGLRFGLWVDWSQAGVDTTAGALNVHDPAVRGWLPNDLPADWKPEEFKGETIDIGLPAAHDYAAKEVRRIVEDNRLDMLEHDGYLVTMGCIRDNHPHAPPLQSTLRIRHDSGFDFVMGSNSTDVSYHAVRAYYDIYERTRREHPGLLFEICNDGGRMVDFGSAAHGDYFSITDTYDPLSNRRAFYDASYVMPPAMLESYVEKWPVPRMENFRYMLRSGMMGWVSVMLDTTAWSAEQHEVARQSIALYKQSLRPLIRDAHLYHISRRPDGVNWDGLEYWDPVRKSGVLFAFRGTVANEPNHSFALAGLDARKHYSLHFEDESSPDREMAGSQLMRWGLAVHLPEKLSSELVFMKESGRPTH